jgi:tetratricopeptide (TPR) repeat protein
MNQNEKALQATKEWEQAIQAPEAKYLVSKDMQIQIEEAYATIYNQLGMHEKALSHAEQGAQLAEVSEEYNFLFSLWTTIGKIYYDLDNTETAKKYYQLALDIEHAVTDEYQLTFAYTNLSEMLLDEQQWTKSELFAKKAMLISKNNPRKLLFIRASLAYARFHLADNSLDKALSILQTAEECADIHQFPAEMEQIIRAMCACYEKSQDEENFYACTVRLYRLKGAMGSHGPEKSEAATTSLKSKKAASRATFS